MSMTPLGDSDGYLNYRVNVDVEGAIATTTIGRGVWSGGSVCGTSACLCWNSIAKTDTGRSTNKQRFSMFHDTRADDQETRP